MITNQQQRPDIHDVCSVSGIFTLALRLVVGWTYFSAFLRRVVLENKLDPDVAGYVGEKFNHFLPNSLGIKPLIEYLVTHPDLLFGSMIAFTIIEGVVGLSFMLGFFTRLMSIGVLSLATGILLGSGWLGTTCLDEWQIGVLGVAAGFTLFLTGGGYFSTDHFLMNKFSCVYKKRWMTWISSGILPLGIKGIKRIGLAGACGIFLLTLYTNQAFHGGVFGPLHNKSVKPEIEISDAVIRNGQLSFTLYRVEGVDVYGSFLVGISLQDENGKTLWEREGEELARFPGQDIRNQYVAQIKPGVHSLIIPLGSKAELFIRENLFNELPKGTYTLVLTDISGLNWKEKIRI